MFSYLFCFLKKSTNIICLCRVFLLLFDLFLIHSFFCLFNFWLCLLTPYIIAWMVNKIFFYLPRCEQTQILSFQEEGTVLSLWALSIFDYAPFANWSTCTDMFLHCTFYLPWKSLSHHPIVLIDLFNNHNYVYFIIFLTFI